MLQVCFQLQLGVVAVRGRAEAGREELPLAQGQGRRPRVPGCHGAVEAKRSYPTPEVGGGGRQEQADAQGAAAVRVQEAERSCFTIKVRRGGCEEIPLVQGKEQRLRFAGAAVKIPHVQGKRNPSKTVGVVRASEVRHTKTQ